MIGKESLQIQHAKHVAESMPHVETSFERMMRERDERWEKFWKERGYDIKKPGA